MEGEVRQLCACPAGKHSVKEHYLASYRKAMAAVVRAQFSASKASAGGRAGALALAENEHIMQSLCCEGKRPGVHPDVAITPSI